MVPALVTLRPRVQTLYVSQNRTVLATHPDGFVSPEPHVGLFVCDTRLLSRYRWLVDGRPPELVASSLVEQRSWLGYYIVTAGDHPKAAQHAVEVRLSRFVGDGFHEDVDLTNFSQEGAHFTLALEVDADFADMRETDGPRKQQGTTSWTSRPTERGCEIGAEYRAHHRYEHDGASGVAHFDAGVMVRVRDPSSRPALEERLVRFAIELPPHASWHACIDVIATACGRTLPLQFGCRAFFGTHGECDVVRKTFDDRATRFSVPSTAPIACHVLATVEQAKADLAALRLDDTDRDQGAFAVSGGLPTYVGLFGRDVLAAGVQASMLTADLLAGAVLELPRWQGHRVDPWRDEEPGRMVHQVRVGPLSVLNFDPLGLSYASMTSSAFFPVAVSELWHWTGDRERVGALIEPALEAIRWLDEHGDLDGDGLYEYAPRSSASIKNQGWKDSDDAIVHADGSQVRTPIATCEVQAFVYLSKLRLSEVLAWFGRELEALRLLRQARELRRRFHEAFWMPEERYVAMGLDPDKRQIRSIASDPGLCLACGIVEESRANAIAARLLSRDMFSGWGIRTLSSDHPAYNPYSYHRGSVWPVDQGAFALGLARYGLHGHVALLARAFFETASLFQHHRLPECFAGHPRDPDHPFPALYPEADWPQAWSASSVFAVLQAMLGIYPYAPLGLLLVDPTLPEWLPEIALENLHVGDAVVDVRFFRHRGRTRHEVETRRGSLHVVRQASPWSLFARPVGRIKEALASLAR